MRHKEFIRTPLAFLSMAFIAILIAFGIFYGYWNSASPEKTCASCHEIVKSVELLAESPHRNLACKDCHGTALSNGFHSLKEKGMMVVHHAGNRYIDNIRLNEQQVLDVMNHCNHCHAAEYADWNAGGHSVRYSHIFLDIKHNRTEQINPDCLRCHGMFSDVPVRDVVEPLDKTGPWKLKNPEIHDRPVIPCLACHQVHKTGMPRVSPDYPNPRNIFYMRQNQNKPAKVSFYSRVERTNIPAEDLPILQLKDKDRAVKVSVDPVMRNCVQCHAPNSHHMAGTSDDRTPRGVHEGIGCPACHQPHSNDAGQSCAHCHPAISNCGIDVTAMNTTYANQGSTHNIHWVACTDCHSEGIPRRN